MEKLEQLYEGKAKKVYKTDDPELLIVDYKDDATAFNGLKKGTIAGKGVINNEMSLRVVNSPLSLPNPSNEAVQLRHDINRLTIEYFNGKYCQKPLAIILKKEFV